MCSGAKGASGHEKALTCVCQPCSHLLEGGEPTQAVLAMLRSRMDWRLLRGQQSLIWVRLHVATPCIHPTGSACDAQDLQKHTRHELCT